MKKISFYVWSLALAVLAGITPILGPAVLGSWMFGKNEDLHEKKISPLMRTTWCLSMACVTWIAGLQLVKLATFIGIPSISLYEELPMDIHYAILQVAILMVSYGLDAGILKKSIQLDRKFRNDIDAILKSQLKV